MVVLLLSMFVEDICATRPGPVDQVLKYRIQLLGFIAGSCTFLIVMGKHINSEITQWTPELPLGVVGGIAGFFAAFLFALEANLFIRVALLVIAAPVFYVLYLWIRRQCSCMQDSKTAKIYAHRLICAIHIVMWMVVLRCIVAAVQYIFPNLGTMGILLISIVTLLLLMIVAGLIRRSSVSLRDFMLFLRRRINKISSVFGGFPMQLVHTALALLMAICVIIFGFWVITLLNDPTGTMQSGIPTGATRIFHALAFCWIG